MPGTYSDNELTKNELTICHQRMLSVSVSVLYINSMTQWICVCVWVWVSAGKLCVTFKKLYYVSLENPAYSSATISAYSDVWCNVFFSQPTILSSALHWRI